MAGDWIKVEKASASKPEVLKVARMLGVSRREAFGLLVEFWCWLDDNCVDGVVDGVVDADVDALMSCSGLSALLVAVGWVEFDPGAPKMRVVNFSRHNGKTAKNRALKSERQGKWRAKTVDATVDGLVDAPPSTREEKRREDITTKSKTTPVAQGAPVGVRGEVWDAWKRQRGKKLTADAVRLQAKFLAAQPDDPNAVIEQSIRNGWAGLFPLKGSATEATQAKRAATAAAMMRTSPKGNDEPTDITAESVRVA